MNMKTNQLQSDEFSSCAGEGVGKIWGEVEMRFVKLVLLNHQFKVRTLT